MARVQGPQAIIAANKTEAVLRPQGCAVSLNVVDHTLCLDIVLVQCQADLAVNRKVGQVRRAVQRSVVGWIEPASARHAG